MGQVCNVLPGRDGRPEWNKSVGLVDLIRKSGNGKTSNIYQAKVESSGI